MHAGGKAPEEIRRRLQGAAFLLILLCSAGLYYTATHELTAATWMLFGVLAAGMMLALWVS